MTADSPDDAEDEPDGTADESNGSADATDDVADEPAEPADASTEATDDASATSGVPTADGDGAPNTLLNALIGAAAGIFLSFLPFSTILGGAIAGYLQGPDVREGAKVGGIAAAMVLLIGFGFVGLIAFFLALFAPAEAFASFLFVVLVAVLASAYFVGTFVVGGVLGSYAKREGLLEDL